MNPSSPPSPELRKRADAGEPGAQEDLGRHLIVGVPVTDPRYGEGVDWLERAAEGGSIEAMLLLGDVHLQFASLPDAAEKARRYYSDAARHGHPDAVERVADLYLIGYGVEVDDAKALSIYRQLCQYGFPHVLCQTAYLVGQGVGCAADPEESTELYLRAAAQDSEVALKILASRLVDGHGMARDEDLAAALIQLDRTRNRPDDERLPDSLDGRARELFIQLTDNRREWSNARSTISESTAEDPQRPLALARMADEVWRRLQIPALSLDRAVRPASDGWQAHGRLKLEPRSWTPRVFSIDDFASAEECALLIDAASPLLRNSDLERSGARGLEIDAFDGDCAVFAPQFTSPLIRNLQRRWSSVLQMPVSHFESASVLRYGPGHEYSRHVDYFDAGREQAHRDVGDYGGQRVITGLVYLRAPEQGGETCYPMSDTLIRGQVGSALVHYNVTPDGLADHASVHEGRPIVTGEKWLLRTAVRVSPIFEPRYKVI